jgi:malonyl-CoA/methylmalonyl-CoA synthetase
MFMNTIDALYGPRAAHSEIYRFGEKVRTTGELRAIVGQFAYALGEFGVGFGDRVSFRLEKSEEVVFLAHACLQIGAILHPLNAGYTDAEILKLTEDAEPRLFVCAPSEAGRFASLVRARVETLGSNCAGSLGERARRSPVNPATTPVGGNDTAALLYTSGTTGRAKGACITHGNLIESAKGLAAVWKLDASDTLLHALPLYHAHGLLTAINSMMVGGGSIRFLPKFDVVEALSALPDCTVMMGVPTFYARLIADDRLASATARLRLAISGSAPLPAEIGAGFLRMTGKTVVERYGATETAITTALPADATDRSGWVGWPLPGVRIRVATPGQRPRALSASGEVETKGHNVFAGYWRDAEATRQAFTDDGWFKTGDIGEIDGTGCLRLLGRSKDLIISGGLNVYPKEVEDALDGLLRGRSSAVFGVPHPDFGEAVVAAIEDADIDAPLEAALVKQLRTILAAYKVPKKILGVPAIPRNPLGKVLKNQLREAHRDLFEPGLH